MSWTDERVELLKQLWGEGLSASQCAGRLDVTRNAVIGKVHRLGLAGRATTSRTRCGFRPRSTFGRIRAPRPVHILPLKPVVAAPRQAKTPQKPVATLAPAAPIGDALMLTVAQLDDRACRYPYGDPRASDFGYCGQHTLHRKAYCGYHDGVVHRKG